MQISTFRVIIVIDSFLEVKVRHSADVICLGLFKTEGMTANHNGKVPLQPNLVPFLDMRFWYENRISPGIFPLEVSSKRVLRVVDGPKCGIGLGWTTTGQTA